jgi:hypothetical protein
LDLKNSYIKKIWGWKKSIAIYKTDTDSFSFTANNALAEGSVLKLAKAPVHACAACT